MEFKLPEEVTKAGNGNARDLVIISIPKMGKGSILGPLTQQKNGIIFDLERGGYEFIEAKRLSIYEKGDETIRQAFDNYIGYRNLLLQNKGKYDFLIVDVLTELDALSEIGGTLAFQNTVQGKSFNKSKTGTEIPFGDADYRSVTSLPDGNGYQHTRKWFLSQIDMFMQISPYRIYAAHIADKMIKDGGKEEVSGAELSLTGKLKSVFASKVSALAKLTADDNKRYLNFDVLNESIIAGSRVPRLQGKILISEKKKDGSIQTFWENVYQ